MLPTKNGPQFPKVLYTFGIRPEVQSLWKTKTLANTTTITTSSIFV